MISIVYDVNLYRRTLHSLVKSGDTVIEIGPHVGRAIREYIERTKLSIAVDKSEQARKGLKDLLNEFSQLRFVQGDARDFETVKVVLKFTRNCDILALDIGGGRFPDTVFKVWSVWSGVFKPRDSIIRNRGLAEFVQRARIMDRSIRKKFLDNGWLSEWGRATPYKLKKQMEEFKFWVDVCSAPD